MANETEPALNRDESHLAKVQRLLKRILHSRPLVPPVAFVLRYARMEAKALEKLLRQHSLDHAPGYKTSYLAYILAEKNLVIREQMQIYFLVTTTIFFLPLIALSYYKLELPNVQNNIPLIIMIYYASFFLILLISTMKISQRHAGMDRYKRISFWSIIKIRRKWLIRMLLIISFIFVLAMVYGITMVSAVELRQSLLTSAGLLLWAAIVIAATSPLRDERFLFWRAPESALMKSLTDAYRAVVRASPAQWRSLNYRLRISARISFAATVLDGPILGHLSASAASLEAPQWLRLRQAAAALRELAGEAIVSGRQVRPELRAALARALTAAAMGNFGDFPKAELRTPQPRRSWLSGIASAIKGLMITLLPPAILGFLLVFGGSYGWTFTQDPATRAILIQFAVLWLLVGLTSATDPVGYQQKLGTISSTGSAIFNWSRSRG